MSKSELNVKGFLNKLIGFSIASWLSAAISFLMTPVITRVYSPEDIGKVNLFITYMTFFQITCIFALDQAYMRFYNEKLPGLNKKNLLKYCLKINLILEIVSIFIILIGYQFFSFQISQSKNYLVPSCLIVTVICSTFLRMSSISSRMEKNILHYTLQVLFVSFIEKILLSIVGVYYSNYKIAILSITAGYIFVTVIFIFIKREIMFSSLKKVPNKTLITILKFSTPYVPILLLSWLNSSIPIVMLRKYESYIAIGIYTNAVTIANILGIIQTGFSAYWGPFIYEHYLDEKNKIFIQKIQKYIIIVLISLAIAIVLFQDVIYLLIGKEFRESKLFFPFLMFIPICNTIADMTGIGIMLSKKSYLNIFTFLGSIIGNLIFSFIFIPKIGVLGAGIAAGVGAIIMLIIRTILGERYYKINNNSFIIISIFIFLFISVVNMILIEKYILKFFILLVVFIIYLLFFKIEIKNILQYICKSNNKL